MKVIFYSHVNKTHFHKNGFALSLVFWEFFELGNRLSFCDVPHGNTDMNFVDFGKAHLPFLFYFGSYSFNRSSAMSVIVFSKIQVTYKLSGHLHSFIWTLHKQWNVDYLTKNAVSSKQSPRRFLWKPYVVPPLQPVTLHDSAFKTSLVLICSAFWIRQC